MVREYQKAKACLSNANLQSYRYLILRHITRLLLSDVAGDSDQSDIRNEDGFVLFPIRQCVWLALVPARRTRAGIPFKLLSWYQGTPYPFSHKAGSLS